MGHAPQGERAVTVLDAWVKAQRQLNRGMTMREIVRAEFEDVFPGDVEQVIERPRQSSPLKLDTALPGSMCKHVPWCQDVYLLGGPSQLRNTCLELIDCLLHIRHKQTPDMRSRYGLGQISLIRRAGTVVLRKFGCLA